MPPALAFAQYGTVAIKIGALTRHGYFDALSVSSRRDFAADERPVRQAEELHRRPVTGQRECVWWFVSGRDVDHQVHAISRAVGESVVHQRTVPLIRCTASASVISCT